MPTTSPGNIKVKEGLERFRSEMGELEELANSIKTMGQIQPIAVNKNMELIAGGRRLAACALYGLDIEYKVIDQENPLQMRELEVEENIQRKDFSPAERVLAVKELHELKQELFSQQANNSIEGKTWSMEDTAALSGRERSVVSRDLQLAELVTAFPELSKCKTRKELTQAGKALEKLITRATSVTDYQEKVNNSQSAELWNLSAAEFMHDLPDNSVDILLCDPPYGIDIHANAIVQGNQTGGKNLQGFEYDDSVPAALQVISTIIEESDRVCTDAAHAYMFTSIELFPIVREIFEAHNWFPYVRPIIWAKPTHMGQSNMPERWPKACYEICVYARREKSKLIEVRADILSYDRVHFNKKIHPTQKPVELLQDLIQRSVFPGATLIDPCMGSGSSLVAGIREKLLVKGSDLEKGAYTAALEHVNTALEESAQDGN